MPHVCSSLTTAALAVGFHRIFRPLGALGLATLVGLGTANAAVLRGRVLGPDGQPVAGAQVAVSGPLAAPVTTVTDAAGVFALEVPDGAVTIRAWAPGMDAPPRQARAGDTDLALALAVRAVSEMLTVTASHVEAPLSSVPDSVTVITRAELLARQTTTLGDALRLVPGFAIARTGGPGTVTSAFPRGGESDFTLVLVDGVRANAFGGGLDLSQVPIADAERIEVVRGPQSALYGADAIGGVVQIITAKGGPLAAFASGEVGGREARTGRASVRGSAGPWYGAASTAYDREGGFTGDAENGTPVTNDDGTVAQLAGSLGWRHGGTDVVGSLQFVETERGSPGPFGSNPVGNFGGVDRIARGLTRRRTAALRLVQPLGGSASRVRLRADADTADFDLEFRTRSTSRGETQRTHGRVQFDAALAAGLAASAGADWLAESGSARSSRQDRRRCPSNAASRRGSWRPGGSPPAACRSARAPAPSTSRARRSPPIPRRSRRVPRSPTTR